MPIRAKQTVGRLFKEKQIDHAVWAEIDLNCLRRNVRLIRQHIGQERQIIGVIKADGYGHGAVQIAKVLIEEGVDCFAVAALEEALALREAGMTQDILVMNSVDPEQIHYFLDHDITPSIFSLSFAQKLQSMAANKGRQIDIHLRIDLAGGHFGVPFAEAKLLVQHILGMDHLHLRGVYTHLISAYNSDADLVEADIKLFKQIAEEIQHVTPVEMIHAASSPAMIRHPSSYFTHVRVGTSLYGLPSLENQELDLQPVMQLKTRIHDIKTLPAGISRGYDYQIETRTERRLAVIPCGYAHVFHLLFQKQGQVLIKGHKVDLFGRAYMNHQFADITDLEDVHIGDEVVLIGNQGSQCITAAEVAQKLGLEVTHCESVYLGSSVPRLCVG